MDWSGKIGCGVDVEYGVKFVDKIWDTVAEDQNGWWMVVSHMRERERERGTQIYALIMKRVLQKDDVVYYY